MTATLVRLLREFADEARLRSRRTNCPDERQAAERLERQFREMLKEAEANLPKEKPINETN